MKKFVLYLVGFVILSLTGNSQNLRAYLSYSIFNTPLNDPYVETYLTINGNSIGYLKLDEGGYQGTVEVQILFKIGDSIVNYAKYELLGPIIEDTMEKNVDFIDVQRYALPEGEYNVEVTLNDKNSDHVQEPSFDKFSIEFPDDEMVFSDIELLSSYKESVEEGVLRKNGYELTPYIFNYYPQIYKKLSFYVELYNSKVVLGDDPFLVTSYIRPFEVDKKLDLYFHRKRANP